MTDSPSSDPSASARSTRRVPPFYPVPVRLTHHGWTVERQANFLGWLAESGSVSAACAKVGMSRNSAYKLRRKPDAESFAAAWDAALGLPFPKVTTEDLPFLAFDGLVRLRFRGGQYLGSWQKPNNSAMLRLVSRLGKIGRLAGGGRGRT